MREVVAAKPAGYKNPVPLVTNGAGISFESCRYVEQDGTPSCIAGTVLATIAPHVLPNFEDALNQELVDSLDMSEFDTWAEALLLAAQNAADAGETWAEALIDAEDRILGP